MQSPAYHVTVSESSGGVCVVCLRSNMYLFLWRHHGFHRRRCYHRSFYRVVCPDDRHPIRRVGAHGEDRQSEYHGVRLSMVSIGFTEKILKYSIKYRYRYR